jgi:hypothetical protein
MQIIQESSGQVIPSWIDILRRFDISYEHQPIVPTLQLLIEVTDRDAATSYAVQAMTVTSQTARWLIWSSTRFTCLLGFDLSSGDLKRSDEANGVRHRGFVVSAEAPVMSPMLRFFTTTPLYIDELTRLLGSRCLGVVTVDSAKPDMADWTLGGYLSTVLECPAGVVVKDAGLVGVTGILWMVRKVGITPIRIVLSTQEHWYLGFKFYGTNLVVEFPSVLPGLMSVHNADLLAWFDSCLEAGRNMGCSTWDQVVAFSQMAGMFSVPTIDEGEMRGC